ILNGFIFVCCLVVFRWVSRQTNYFRHVIIDPIWTVLKPDYGKLCDDCLIVFPLFRLGPFPAKSKLKLQKTETGFQLSNAVWFLPANTLVIESVGTVTLTKGLLVNSINLELDNENRLLISRRYNDELEQVCQEFGLDFVDDEIEPEPALG
ncbi:MAG: hypothetical protein AAF939_16725, partial [Planctomycetota bacterium]